MPRNTKFNNLWLTLVDKNGHCIGEWCSSNKSDEYSVLCSICNKIIDIRNGGITQIYQHSEGKKHKGLCQNILNQTKFSISTASTGEKTVSMTSNKKWTIGQSDLISKAEMIWTMKVAESNYSFLSCSNVCEQFKTMFSDSEIAKSMTLGSNKVSYEVSNGLGPFFHNEMVTQIKNSKCFFTLSFDEATTDIGTKQLDVHIRYWSDKRQQIEDRFFKSAVLGHATAQVLKKTLMKMIDDDGLDVKRLLMIGSDGPAVNKKLLTDIDTELKERGNPGLIRIGTCNLHIVHNGFGAGLDKVAHWEIGDFLDYVFRWFHKFPARKEDFQEIQQILDLSNTVFMRYVSNRWLTIVPVISRLLDLWDGLIHYFLSFLPKNKMTTKQTGNMYFKCIQRALRDPATLPRLYFLKSVGEQFQHFLTVMQSEGPLIHVLYDEMESLIKSLMGRFVKLDVVSALTSGQKIKCFDNNPDNLLEAEKVDFGVLATAALKKLKESESKKFMHDAKGFLTTVTTYLVTRIPLDNVLLKCLKCLHPLAREQPASLKFIQRVAEQMPHIIPRNEIEKVVCEWKMYAVLDVPETESAFVMGEGVEDGEKFVKWRRLDHYWASVLSEIDNLGCRKFPTLGKLVKVAITLSHGQAQVERGFSQNKHIVTVSRSALNIETVNGLRTTQDEVRLFGSPSNVPITKRSIEAFQDANKKYKAFLEAQKFTKEKQKQSIHVKETESAAKRKMNDTNELLKDQQKLQEKLNQGNDLIREASARLNKACSGKNMKDVFAAQALLDSGKQIVTESSRALEKTNNKIAELVKKSKRS